VSCNMRSVLVVVVARFRSISSTWGSSCVVSVASLFDVLSIVLISDKAWPTSSRVWSVVAATLDVSLLRTSQCGSPRGWASSFPVLVMILTD
jgi:hypothetical protein